MAVGDIGSIIDSLDYLNEGGFITRLIHVAGGVYLVGDRVGASPFETMVFSFSVDAAGNISNAVIDSLLLHSQAGAAGAPPGGFAHVSGDVFAAAYMTYYKTVVGTFTCDSSGNLGAAVIDTIELADAHSNKSYLPDIEKITGNVFAVSFTDGFSSDGWMKTITINDDGSIDEPELDLWEWGTLNGEKPYILQVSAAHYLQIEGTGGTHRPSLEEVNITDAGVISRLSGISPFGSGNSGGGTVHRVSGDVYVIFYAGGVPANRGMMATVTCNFVDPPALIDSWEYYSGATGWPRAVEISRNQAGNGKVFAVATAPGVPDTDDQLNTIEVLNDGTITKSIIDFQQIAAGYAYGPDILRHAEGIYLISARRLTPAKQTLYTVDIEEAVVAGAGGIAHQLLNPAFI